MGIRWTILRNFAVEDDPCSFFNLEFCSFNKIRKIGFKKWQNVSVDVVNGFPSMYWLAPHRAFGINPTVWDRKVSPWARAKAIEEVRRALRVPRRDPIKASRILNSFFMSRGTDNLRASSLNVLKRIFTGRLQKNFQSLFYFLSGNSSCNRSFSSAAVAHVL